MMRSGIIETVPNCFNSGLSHDGGSVDKDNLSTDVLMFKDLKSMPSSGSFDALPPEKGKNKVQNNNVKDK